MSTTDGVPTKTAPTAEEQLQYKRRLFETADRSYMNDRLNVPIPAELHGEWIGVDDFSQFHAREKGFIDGSEYLTTFNKLHDRPDGNAVGDVKFMVIPKWKKEAQDEVDRHIAQKRSGVSSDAKNEEYRAYAESLGLGVEPDKSTGRVLVGSELSAHLPKR